MGILISDSKRCGKLLEKWKIFSTGSKCLKIITGLTQAPPTFKLVNHVLSVAWNASLLTTVWFINLRLINDNDLHDCLLMLQERPRCQFNLPKPHSHTFTQSGSSRFKVIQRNCFNLLILMYCKFIFCIAFF